MGIVKSTIYATTASEAMTQLNFSTDFEGAKTIATTNIDLIQGGKKVATETYILKVRQLISEISLKDSKISSEGTITLASDGNAVAFSGVCVWENVTSFRTENIAIAYR